MMTAHSPREQTLNVFSVDVEDYFQVGAFEGVIRRERWDEFECRVEGNTDALLVLCARHGVRGTFFILGWVAERFPDLVRRIHAAGHEAAVHGYDHQRVTEMTPEQFRQDVRRSKRAVEDLIGTPVLGYRAPNYSIVRQNLWAMDVLLEEGFAYDSSIFPTKHRRYGIAAYPRFPWVVRGQERRLLVELPISTVQIGRFVLPFIGGAYLRHFPFAYVRWALRRVNRRERQPAVLYTHPWEIDAAQPRQPVDRINRFRHYRNLHRTAERLERLFREFRFTTAREVLAL
jgi:polysaccharide deacetylase family protein (PEP-CTERM system associated)